MILVEGLVKRYRKAKRNAVDGIDFEVKAGEFYTVPRTTRERVLLDNQG
jgi:ABC-type multidrug transport system ATPase subunit